MLSLWFVIVVIVPIISSICDEKDGVFCQEGDNKDIREEWDYGFNIWSSDESRSNCNLRFSRIYSDYTCIDTEWIDPTKNLLIVSHGGRKDGANPDHYMGSSWKDWVSAQCVEGANVDGVEHCPPTEPDAHYWMSNSWNIIFVDWRYYANDENIVPYDAEERLYTAVHEDYSVADLLYEKLVALLDLTSWDGDELRFAGHSLGAQVVLLLAAKLITDTSHNYGVKLARIALLDAYYSTGQKWFLPEKSPCERNWWEAWWTCRKKWVGEYVREDLMWQIRSNIETAPVIENYRTSAITGQDVASFAIGDLGPGDDNWEFNKMTVFVDLKVYYYPSGSLGDLDPIGWKHAAALPIYTHCMKWESMHGDLFDGAPSCRMDTDDLKLQCPITNWWDHCQYWYEQKHDDAAYTTWDYDDRFYRMDWDMINVIHPPSGSSSDKYIIKFNVVDYGVMAAVIAVFVSILWLVYFICFGRKREQKYSPVAQDSDLSSDNKLTDSDV